LVHVTRDGGKNWDKVTPKGMPQWIQINAIDASPHNAERLTSPRLLTKPTITNRIFSKLPITAKAGKKSSTEFPMTLLPALCAKTRTAKDFFTPERKPECIIRRTTAKRGNLYRLNLPVVPITDLAVHKREADLVVATQVVRFTFVDNLPLLYQMADVQKQRAFLFKTRRRVSHARAAAVSNFRHCAIRRQSPTARSCIII
jgi:hypothetical protein